MIHHWRFTLILHKDGNQRNKVRNYSLMQCPLGCLCSYFFLCKNQILSFIIYHPSVLPGLHQIQDIIVETGQADQKETHSAKDALLLWCQMKTAG